MCIELNLQYYIVSELQHWLWPLETHSGLLCNIYIQKLKQNMASRALLTTIIFNLQIYTDVSNMRRLYYHVISIRKKKDWNIFHYNISSTQGFPMHDNFHILKFRLNIMQCLFKEEKNFAPYQLLFHWVFLWINPLSGKIHCKTIKTRIRLWQQNFCYAALTNAG